MRARGPLPRSPMPPVSDAVLCLLRKISLTAAGWRRTLVTLTFSALAVTLLLTCVAPYTLAVWFLDPPPSRAAYRTAEVILPFSSSPSPSIGKSPVFDATVSPPSITRTAILKATVPPPVIPGATRTTGSRARRKRSGGSRSRRKAKREEAEGAAEVVAERAPVTELDRWLWSLRPDEALAYARKEIEDAPIVVEDPELHGPLFRNVSVFKRSYELMEKILKIYVYRDGDGPIFHTPQLFGIYASEGWFMKLLEESKQFVTGDPDKAHLFYLPYSASQLRLTLYVPESHNLRPLAIFLQDYVNSIAAKYPFWNRTRGSDHFLVACHDWGPYTTTAHEELVRNTIKALCNADTSEKIFIKGRDVSLPETTIKVPKRPLRGVGGRPVSQRSILAFYAGNMHGRVRPVLRKYWDGKDEDMRIYGLLPHRIARNMSYTQHMKTSKFCICPMGYEVNSPRIVEAIYYECVPVIIADNFVPPLDEVLNWSTFSVIVEEKDIPNLKNILLSISPRRYISMQRNVQRLQKHFLWHQRPVKYDMFHMILHSIWFNRLNQIELQR